MKLAQLLKRGGLPPILIALAAVIVACGTDFPDAPGAQAVSSPTPRAEPTIFRTIPVTPAPTSTPIPLIEGELYSAADQRQFPEEIESAGSKTPLPGDTVVRFWADYLANAHVVVEERSIDMHLCEDGRIIPVTQVTDDGQVQRGAWGVRPAGGITAEWFEVALGREFGRGRLATIVVLSRNGGRTVAIDDGITLVSITDSDLCGS